MTTLSKRKPHGQRFKDLVGQQYGRLTVQAFAGFNSYGNAHWECVCSCAKQVVVASGHLQSGHTRSCGCLNDDSRVANNLAHGKAHTTEYRILMDVITRCYNPKHSDWHRYGRRGVTVCDRWRFGENNLSGIECFIADMGLRPSPRYSVDRYPNKNGDYEPSNCRWATQREQQNNRTNNITVTIDGEKMTLAQAVSHRFGEDSRAYQRTYMRLKRGASVEAAFAA
jgi:hypothetical protein